MNQDRLTWRDKPVDQTDSSLQIYSIAIDGDGLIVARVLARWGEFTIGTIGMPTGHYIDAASAKRAVERQHWLNNTPKWKRWFVRMP